MILQCPLWLTLFWQTHTSVLVTYDSALVCSYLRSCLCLSSLHHVFVTCSDPSVALSAFNAWMVWLNPAQNNKIVLFMPFYSNLFGILIVHEPLGGHDANLSFETTCDTQRRMFFQIQTELHIIFVLYLEM